MKSIKYQNRLPTLTDQHRDLPTLRNKQQKLKTNASFMGKTLQTEESMALALRNGQTLLSPKYISISQSYNFNLKTQQSGDLGLQSRVKAQQAYQTFEEEQVRGFLDKMKMINFISQQQRKQQAIIFKKRDIIRKYKQQIQKQEQQIKIQKINYQKQLNIFRNKKQKISKYISASKLDYDHQILSLNLQIQKLRKKIKSTKMKTQSATISVIQNKRQKNKNRLKYKQTKNPIPFPNYFYPYMMHQSQIPMQFNNFRQLQIRNSSQNTFHQENLASKKQYHQLQTKLHKINGGRWKTQATEQLKTKREEYLQNSQQVQCDDETSPQINKKNIKAAKIEKIKIDKTDKCQKQDYGNTKYINNKDKFNSKKPKNKNDIKYIDTSDQKANKSKYANSSEQQIKDNQHSHAHNFEQSLCTNWKNGNSDEQLVQLLSQSIKDYQKKVPRQESTSHKGGQQIKLQKYSSSDERKEKSSDRNYNSGIHISLQASDDKWNQSSEEKSSNGQNRKRSLSKQEYIKMQESPVTIEVSELSQSKVSRRSRSNSFKNQIQSNRYTPLLLKQCILIEEQSEEMLSLKNTPNDRITPKNNSQNSKSKASTPKNSQNHRKTIKLQQMQEVEQQPFSPLKHPPHLANKQDIQNDGILNNIKLNTESKVSRGLMPIMAINKFQQEKHDQRKDDDEMLNSITLVGQSKISRLRSQSQRRQLKEMNDDVDLPKELRTNSQIKKYNTCQNEQSQGIFDLSLSQQSTIIKKNGKTTNNIPTYWNADKGRLSEKSRLSTQQRQLSSIPIQQNQEQYQDFPSNKTKKPQTFTYL